jgi:catechol 2,3-dioxygenase-like lactoylglutathione lyase family enzyme
MAAAETSCSALPAGVGLPPTPHACAPGDFPATPPKSPGALRIRRRRCSPQFYETVLGFLGYRRTSTRPDYVDWNLAGGDGLVCSIGLKAARSDREHDRYSAGLHHPAWHAVDRADVDSLHKLLVGQKATILDPPTEYPAYGAGYYAVFFADPDGLKLEFVHYPGEP